MLKKISWFALIAIVGSPFLFAPGVAAVTVIGLTFNPDVVRARWVVLLVAVLCAAVLVPMVAEHVGWLAPTFASSNNGIMFSPPTLRLSDNGRVAFMIIYALTLIAAAAVLSFRYVRRERELRYRLYLQIWHVQRHG